MRRSILAFTAATALLSLASRAGAQVTIAVDPAADARPISPLIYGMNFPSDQHVSGGRLTVARWGGNSVSRYNYKIDVHNTAADYFFENLPGCWGDEQSYCANPPADPQEQSGANAFLASTKNSGMVALFTIPTIGFTPKGPPKYNHPFDCGCPSIGNASDPYDTACGNGDSGNGYLDCGPASNTSMPIDPAWVKDWVSYIVGKFGPSNGQRVYALDNEPALWSSTHHDIRKTRLGYDELWQRMRDYAVAVLEADPTAEIAGPAEWGWPNYLCSDADNINQGCSATSPDRAAHGGQELLAWLLDQAKAYEQQNGKRILHYLDLHYYPQGGNTPEVTRSLWDKSYKDPSWIGEEIFLLPRMHDWVDQHYPGTKLAVSEYDFYHHDQPIGAVAYAEVLGIFGREGLDMATAWSPPDPGEAAFAAFRLYRNFDGKGGQFESVSVRATVTGSGVEAYAAVGKDRLTVVLVNELGSAVDADVTLGNFMPGATGAVYANGAGGAVVQQPDVAVAGGKAKVPLAPTSITMLVVDGMNPNQLPDAGAPASSSSSSGASGPGGAGGAGGSGGSGGGSSGDSKGGCGCRVADGGDDLTWLGAAGLVAIAARRRRRIAARR